MGLYLDFLIMQYKLSNGIQNIDINSQAFTSDFTSWINSRKTVGKDYIYFLQSMKFNLNTNDCAEVGKGNLDSLVKDLDTTIISPFASTFKETHESKIINANMKVVESAPILVSENETSVVETEIPSYLIHTYMTQNPYLKVNIENWYDLHNSGRNNIIVGVYGNTFDKDIESKINQIKRIKENLIDNYYKESYEVSNDSYFYALGSFRNPVQLVKKLDSNKVCKCRTYVKKKYF